MNQPTVFRLALAGLVVSTGVVIACSGPAPSSPSAVIQSVSSGQDGRAGASAAGDVKTGSAPLEIDAVRLDRQKIPGTLFVRYFADPGRIYPMDLGETIELWVEWDRGDGEFRSGSVENPRLLVDWGEGGEVQLEGCGSCKVNHIYGLRGLYTVRVTLKDNGDDTTTVTRTFFLDSREPDTGTGTGTSII